MPSWSIIRVSIFFPRTLAKAAPTIVNRLYDLRLGWLVDLAPMLRLDHQGLLGAPIVVDRLVPRKPRL